MATPMIFHSISILSLPCAEGSHMHAPFAVVHALFALFAVAPTETALAHGFKPGRSSTELLWHHTSLPPTSSPPPPLPPPKEGAMVSAMVPSFANSSGQWQRALPRFDSLKALCAEPFWKGYLDAVYGGALDFPIDLRRLWFFYINYLHIRPPASLPFLSTELINASRRRRRHPDVCSSLEASHLLDGQKAP